MARRYKVVYMGYYLDEGRKTPVCVDYMGWCLMAETRAGLSAMIVDAFKRGYKFPPFGQTYPDGHPSAGQLVRIPPYDIRKVRVDWSESKEIELRKEQLKFAHARKEQEAGQKGWEKPPPVRFV